MLQKTQIAKEKSIDGELEEQIKLAYQEYKMEQVYNANIDFETFINEKLREKYGTNKLLITKLGKNLKIEIIGKSKIYILTYEGILKEKEKVDPMEATSVYGKLENGTLYLKSTEDDDYILYTSSRVIQSDWKNIFKINIEEPIAPTTCYEMFRGFENCTEIEGIEKLHTENSTNIWGMFCGCKSLNSIDVSKFDISNVTDMGAMFYACSGLKSIDVSGFDTRKITSLYETFSYCSSLTKLDLSSFNTSRVGNMCEMLLGCSSLENVDVSSFDTGNATSFSYMFKDCSSLNNLYIKNFNTIKAKSMESMFYGCVSLTSLDLSSFNTSIVTNMSAMFCKLNIESLNLSNFDTNSVTNMKWMFSECKKLKKLDISNFTINHNNYDYIVSGVPNDIKIIASESVASKIINNSDLTPSNFEQ